MQSHSNICCKLVLRFGGSLRGGMARGSGETSSFEQFLDGFEWFL